jgi:hypothetical protein
LVLVVGVLIFNTYCFRTHGTYKNIYKAYKDLSQQKIELKSLNITQISTQSEIWAASAVMSFLGGAEVKKNKWPRLLRDRRGRVKAIKS